MSAIIGLSRLDPQTILISHFNISYFRDGFALTGYASSDDGTDPLGLLSVVATPNVADVPTAQTSASINNYDSQTNQQALKVDFFNLN
jgi:hypothetical protein